MVRIRLTRMGKKHQPFYRLIVVDQRKKRDGAYIENLGYYNPLNDADKTKIEFDKAVEWIMKGAQPSLTARKILSKAGVMAKVDELKNKKEA